jgi:hypothetical protein
MKERVRKLINLFIIILLFILFVITFFDYIKSNAFVLFPIIFFNSTLVYIITELDTQKYKKNNPYVERKVKKSFLSRIFISFFAGLHYTHAIFTYNHKKYNTQVFYPKTFECYLGVTFAILIIFLYSFLAYLVSLFLGWKFIFILLIPVLTNLISFILNRKK